MEGILMGKKKKEKYKNSSPVGVYRQEWLNIEMVCSLFKVGYANNTNAKAKLQAREIAQ